MNVPVGPSNGQMSVVKDHAPFRRELIVTAGAQPSVDHQPLVDAPSPRARCAKLTRKRSIQSRGEVVHSV